MNLLERIRALDADAQRTRLAVLLKDGSSIVGTFTEYTDPEDNAEGEAGICLRVRRGEPEIDILESDIADITIR